MPTSTTTCAGGSPSGASLTFDAERRLTNWQNAPTNPTSQAWFLYDGEGHRVEQYMSGGSGSHTYYLPGNVEEVTPSGTLVKYYTAGGLALGLNTTSDSSGSGIAYLVSDGLGSVSEALSPTGTASGIQLYSPYGTVRYSSGVMPTAKGFTGQYSDAATSGLDYYGARYYDPQLGQFTSADTVTDGLNRYGYVKGNPETFTDPTGHRIYCGDGDCGAPPPPPPPPDCHATNTCSSTSGGGKGGGGKGGGGKGGGGGITYQGCGGGTAGGFATPLSDCGDLSGEQIQQLYDEAQREGLNLPQWEIEEMVSLNPDLQYHQYELLVQLWGEGTRAFDVKEIAYAYDGRLVWLTASQLEHIIIDHGDDFRNYFSIRVEGIPIVSEETVIGTIFDFLMNQQPDGVKGNRYSYGFWASLYDRWRGVEKTFDIAVADNGMIITAFVP